MAQISSMQQKPMLRGVFHQVAAVFSVIFGAILLFKTNQIVFWGNFVYITSVISLFAISALYHRLDWSPEARKIMRKADHAAIYFLIAGTYTPIILTTFPAGDVDFYLVLIWSIALAGILKSLLWISAPKYLVALLCVLLGWVVVFEWHHIAAQFSLGQTRMLFGGGIAYTVGALAYAVKWPNPFPRVFGYHEIFHIMTIIAAALHGSLIFQVTMG